MDVTYQALLALQRKLHDLPRGMERFRQYLGVTLNEDGTDVELPPLVIVNPMAKDHVAAMLDALLAMDADGIAARALAEVSVQLENEGSFEAALVVADDLGGGWTNRYAVEYNLRRIPNPAELKPRQARRFWVTGVLWSSEQPSARTVRETILTAIHRTAHVLTHGTADTLRDLLAQEGYAMARADCTTPALDADDIAYTREVLAPILDATDMRTCIECLFGDDAGRTLGFTPRGLSPSAGLALALYDAQ